MNIYWYSLVFGLLVLRAIAPPPLPEHLPSHGEIPRGIAEQLGPPLERVGSGPLEGGTTAAEGRLANRRDSTRLSGRIHGATSVQTARATDVQLAPDGHQSQWRDLEAGISELSTEPVPQNRFVRLYLSSLRCMPSLSWRMPRLSWRMPRLSWRSDPRLSDPHMREMLLDEMRTMYASVRAARLPVSSQWESIPTQVGTMDNLTLLLQIQTMNEEVKELLTRSGAYGEWLKFIQSNLERNLKEGDPIPHTTTLQYMPRPLDYEPETPGANAFETVTLDQAIGMLEATSTTVPESGAMDVDGIIKEQNKNREKTEGDSRKDQSTSQQSIHHDAEGSTRPTSSLQDTSEVLLGDPLHADCAICLQEFSEPKKNSENAWVFENIVKVDNCVHYFHRNCLGMWINIKKENSCPTCRTQVSPLILVPEP
ncbi:hypothetical protein MJO29_012319 [Puccinia striiformis f. sp. tritici]|nr:hypothetical protein MJO29_012319 [Puccinia striiformis f. sp. tritici]